jgi:hypothetical protein
VSAVLAPAPDDPPVALRCEDAEAGGLDVPAALITTMVAMATITSPTGTSAAMTGWRERNRAGGGVSPRLALGLELDDALDLGAGRLVDVDFFVLLVGRAGRDDPDGDFDIVFSLDEAGTATGHACSKARDGGRGGLPGLMPATCGSLRPQNGPVGSASPRGSS